MGKSVRIFLADGTATGIRHGEIVNWTGQGLACPRARFLELREWQEIRRPGVYFLFGFDDNDRNAVYIGEAEDVFDRIRSHVDNKDFWNELIAFTSKDDNLTKAHVKFLESQLHDIAVAADQYAVQNSQTPQLAGLPRSDRDAMQEFIDGIRVLLGVFGHRVLEPPVPRRAVNAAAAHLSAANAAPAVETSHLPAGIGHEFTLRVSGIFARAVRSDEGLVVLSGSEAAKENAGSLSGGYRARKERMIAEGVLKDAGSKFVFDRDYSFTSPSQAAAIIVGYSINGRDNWCTETGETYKHLEERETLQLARQDGDH
ncbi:GIY-YIG nuclease family protein [Trinickia mobilis]|uniref:GIY-YIG nuclease family protein n=1 Tax=Trinickia mobilis TaxID=2816356 RepID=UPI001A90B864|nr:GIY-YIG nuclease family protein [Trinickia mobilis]